MIITETKVTIADLTKGYKDDDCIGKHMCSIDNGRKFTYYRILIRKKAGI